MRKYRKTFLCLYNHVFYTHLHHSWFEGHLGKRHIYDSMQMEYYWMHIQNGVYQTVKDCCECFRKNQSGIDEAPYLFPPSGPQKLVAMGSLYLIPKTFNANQLVLIMTDPCSEVTRGVQNFEMTLSHIVLLFMDNWIVRYGILTHVLTENETHFTNTFFETLCSILGTEHLTLKSCHPQTTGKAKRFNEIIMATLQHCVPEHHRLGYTHAVIDVRI